MRVDVRGSRSLRMPRPIAHRLQRNPRCKKQRDVRMPQGMNRDLRQISPRNEIMEPPRDAVRVDWRTVVLREQTVAVNPAIAHDDSLLPLPFSMCF